MTEARLIVFLSQFERLWWMTTEDLDGVIEKLELLGSDYLALPVRIEPNAGRWIVIANYSLADGAESVESIAIMEYIRRYGLQQVRISETWAAAVNT